MEKINIAELLKDCPSGMELYSPIFGKVYLDKIRPHLAIVVTTDKEQGDFKEEFLYDGRYGINGECMLFPSKSKTTWEGFVPPIKFKDGDIVFSGVNLISILLKSLISILKEIKPTENLHCYVSTDMYGKLYIDEGGWTIQNIRLATEEEKAKLFRAIKDNGYKWNEEKKVLEKLRKFKVGDIIRLKSKPNYIYTIHSLTWDDNKKLAYRLLPKNDKHLILVSLNTQDNYELVPNKFDINTLVPFESRVLVRDTEGEKWEPAIWGYYDVDHIEGYPYETIGGNCFCFCIPYEDNEHLLGTTDDCADFYKIW